MQISDFLGDKYKTLLCLKKHKSFGKGFFADSCEKKFRVVNFSRKSWVIANIHTFLFGLNWFKKIQPCITGFFFSISLTQEKKTAQQKEIRRKPIWLANLVTLTEVFLNGKFYFLCSVCYYLVLCKGPTYVRGGVYIIAGDSTVKLRRWARRLLLKLVV